MQCRLRHPGFNGRSHYLADQFRHSAASAILNALLEPLPKGGLQTLRDTLQNLKGFFGQHCRKQTVSMVLAAHKPFGIKPMQRIPDRLCLFAKPAPLIRLAKLLTKKADGGKPYRARELVIQPRKYQRSITVKYIHIGVCHV